MLDQRTLDQATADFEHDGYYVWRGFFGPKTMNELMAQIDRYVSDVVPTLPKERAYFEDKNDPRTLFRLEKMNQADAWFDDLFQGDPLITVARTLLKDGVKPQQVSFFGKAPRIGEPTPPHQDGYYWKLVPNEGVTMWLALDTVDEANGCLRYVPGSHRKPMRDHSTSETFGFSLGVSDFGEADEAREVAICAEPGDLVVHHGMTIHRADGNQSDRLRRAMGFVYFAARAVRDVEAAESHAKAMREKWEKENKL